MSTMAAIAEALRSTIATAISADFSSITDYLPSIQTRDTALIIPAFGQQSRFGPYTFENAATYQTHRLRCEIWVKQKGSTDVATRARAQAALAIRSIFDAPTLGGVVETIGWFDGDSNFDYAIEAEVADQFVNVGNANYLVITLIVPVTDFSLP